MLVLKPPSPLVWPKTHFSLFLAGTMDDGVGPDWQAEMEKSLIFLDGVLLNPRRDNWVPGETNFREQALWELEGLQRSSLILMYFVPGSKSPISLQEQGLFARSGRMLVCCPPGFWRRENVLVVCELYKIPTVPDLESALRIITRKALAHPQPREP